MEKHEEVYRQLREHGCGGWGGKNYEARMDGLKTNIDKLLDVIKLKGGKALEMGSGAGDLSLMLFDQGFDVTGIEISPTAVEWAKEKANGKGRFICGSVTDQRILKDEQFDIILDGNCLHCLFDEDRKSFYENVVRLLKEDGYLYLATVMANQEGETAEVGPIPRCFLTKKELLAEANEYDFVLETSWIKVHETYSHFCGVFSRK